MLKRIPYEDLKFEEEIGSGAYGIVYKGQWNGETVAIKESKNSDDLSSEILTLASFSHENIVAFKGFSMKGNSTYFLVMEYIPSNLDKELKTVDSFKILRGIINGMIYIHEQKLIHRDLKPTNILINSSGVVKIADVGISRPFPSQNTLQEGHMTRFGSGFYLAPEIRHGGIYNWSIDVYSFGKIIEDLLQCNTKLVKEEKEFLDQVMKDCNSVPEKRPTFVGLKKRFEEFQNNNDLVIVSESSTTHKNPNKVLILDSLQAESSKSNSKTKPKKRKFEETSPSNISEEKPRKKPNSNTQKETCRLCDVSDDLVYLVSFKNKKGIGLCKQHGAYISKLSMSKQKGEDLWVCDISYHHTTDDPLHFKGKSKKKICNMCAALQLKLGKII